MGERKKQENSGTKTEIEMNQFQIAAIRGYVRNGMSPFDIAVLLDVSLTTVTRIINEYFK